MKNVLLIIIAVSLITLNIQVISARRAAEPKPSINAEIVEVVGNYEARIPYHTGGNRDRFLVRHNDGTIRTIDMPYKMEGSVKFLAIVGEGRYVPYVAK